MHEIHLSEQIRNWATVASVFVAMFAFYFVIRQIRLNHRTYRERSYGDLYSQQQAITKLFFDKPELRPYFYSGTPCTDEKHRVLCEILAEKITVSFEFIWLILPTLPEDVQDGWEHFMKFIYTNSPALQSHISEYPNWYDPDLLSTLGYTTPPSESTTPGIVVK